MNTNSAKAVQAVFATCEEEAQVERSKVFVDKVFIRVHSCLFVAKLLFFFSSVFIRVYPWLRFIADTRWLF